MMEMKKNVKRRETGRISSSSRFKLTQPRISSWWLCQAWKWELQLASLSTVIFSISTTRPVWRLCGEARPIGDIIIAKYGIKNSKRHIAMCIAVLKSFSHVDNDFRLSSSGRSSRKTWNRVQREIIVKPIRAAASLIICDFYLRQS